MDRATAQQSTIAESFLRSLKNRGIEHVFANAGTDFAPVIEGLVRIGTDSGAAPRFLTIPHENLAVAMAHGYYLTCGKPAAVMVHVTVGTANTVCALMNAYRDNVPLLLIAGRTPHTQSGHIASRSAPIHWGQENFDQDGIVREYTKWAYELRAGQSPDQVIARALEVAMAEPRGPVYLTLPREVLANIDEGPAAAPATVASTGSLQPSQAHIHAAAKLLANADRPVIVTSHLGRDRQAVDRLAALADTFAIPVTQANPTCINLPASHPMNTGQRGNVLLGEADCILVADSEVPWFPRSLQIRPNTQVVHLGIDPIWSRYPIRSFPTNMSIPGNTTESLRLLAEALHADPPAHAAVERRRKAVKEFQAEQHAAAAASLASAKDAIPIRYDYVAACLRDALPDDGIVLTELGVSADQLGLDTPGSLIGVGIGGGLGFGLGASLGAKLAAPERTVVTTLGDGSYMFGNPTPFHFVSRAANLPTLTIVCNNGRWNAVDAATRSVYPNGAAAAEESMPLVELAPTPEFAKVAEASGAHARRVDDPRDLPDAIRAAFDALAQGCQALLDVRVEHGRR